MRKVPHRFKPYKDPVIGASVVVANSFKAWLKKRGLEHGVRPVSFGKKRLTPKQVDELVTLVRGRPD